MTREEIEGRVSEIITDQNTDMDIIDAYMESCEDTYEGDLMEYQPRSCISKSESGR